jgi:hypothetical protein
MYYKVSNLAALLSPLACVVPYHPGKANLFEPWGPWRKTPKSTIFFGIQLSHIPFTGIRVRAVEYELASRMWSVCFTPLDPFPKTQQNHNKEHRAIPCLTAGPRTPELLKAQHERHRSLGLRTAIRSRTTARASALSIQAAPCFDEVGIIHG